MLLQRRWVAGHLLVLTLTGTFVALGVWQLARNSHKHQLVAREKAAYAKPAPDITALPDGAASGTRVAARGIFDGAHETVLRNQVGNGGNVGVDVLTPLRLADGRAVLVDRGWVSSSATSGLATGPPPSGTAVVHGLYHPSSALGPGDTVTHLPDGRLAVPRVDIIAIGRSARYRLLPGWIQAQAISPPPGSSSPQLPQPPAPDPVNHMEYAIEWFGFALIGIIGWPIALRRLVRRQRVAATSSTAASTASTEPVTSRNGRAGSRASRP